jgi:5-methylcytosine-specific restriction enzyme subunit McrC
VIDTKWKLPERNKPSDNDLKQMFAYNHYWKCTHSLLLYPSDSTESGLKGGYSEKVLINEKQKDHYCSMGYLDLVEYNQNKGWNLSSAVLNMLEINPHHSAV